MFKSCFLAQETADLEIGIDAFLEPAKYFENQTVAIHNGSVALISFNRRWFEGRLRRASQGAEKLPWNRKNFIGFSSKAATTRNGIEQRVGKIAVVECVDKQSLESCAVVLPFDARNHRLRERLLDFQGSIGSDRRHGQNIDLRLAFPIQDFHGDKLGIMGIHWNGNGLGKTYRPQFAPFATEPTALLQVARQDFF